MSAIHFYAVGIPKGQPRPRAFKLGNQVRVYDPATAEAWKSAIAAAAEPFVGAWRAEAAVSLGVDFYFPRPKTHFNKHGLRESAPLVVTGKPDIDNALKAVMDALTGLGFWRDDAQVVCVYVYKFYSAPGKRPGALITIREVSNEGAKKDNAGTETVRVGKGGEAAGIRTVDRPLPSAQRGVDDGGRGQATLWPSAQDS